jgi:hypothetical protein
MKKGLSVNNISVVLLYHSIDFSKTKANNDLKVQFVEVINED